MQYINFRLNLPKILLVAKLRLMINPEFRKHLIKQLVTLSTAGFGLVAALAWNDAIQSFVNTYIDRFLQTGTGVFSRFLYAFLITALAVYVTYQLSKLAQKVEEPEDKSKREKLKA